MFTPALSGDDRASLAEDDATFSPMTNGVIGLDYEVEPVKNLLREQNRGRRGDPFSEISWRRPQDSVPITASMRFFIVPTSKGLMM